MTLDERLEKLTERHEALAQSLEILALDHRALSPDVKTLESIVRQVVGGISDLATIARSHEGRRSNLEGN